MWQRLDLRRVPVLTITVFLVTAVVSIAQLTFAPSLLADLQRTPAGLHGDWWRTVTSLTVQDGGWAGALSNLIFLLALGATAEQLVSRWRWAVCYLGAGLAGELVAYSWQPTGGGNSVANCGLAAIVVIAVMRSTIGGRDERPGPLTLGGPAVAALWIGVLLATWHYPLILIGVVAVPLTQIAVQRGWARYALPAFAVAVGVLLCAVANIHGAALLTGLVIAAIPAPNPLPASKA
jgi:membrane associated rhomboid family serine protease